MSSSKGSIDEVEDWLDLNRTPSLPSLSLDDVLQQTENLDEGFSIGDDGLTTADDSSISYLCASPSNSQQAAPSYVLDSNVAMHTHQSISHQLSTNRQKAGAPVAIAEGKGKIAVATNRGHVVVFDFEVFKYGEDDGTALRSCSTDFVQEGHLEHYHQGEEWTGSASCVAFSEDGKQLAVGFSKGAVKIINTKNGAVLKVVKEAVQTGMGVLQVIFLPNANGFLTLDSGGSVYEIRQKARLTGGREAKIRCVFSGCNGEVVCIKVLPLELLALLTVTKVLLVSTRHGGSVLCAFPVNHSHLYPPLFGHFQSEAQISSSKVKKELKVCVARGDKVVIYRVHPANFRTKHKAATWFKTVQFPTPLVNLHWLTDQLIVAFDTTGAVWQIDVDKEARSKAMIDDVPLIFASADFKGLATGGRVSDAMRVMAELICFPSVTRATCSGDHGTPVLLALTHDGLKIIEPISEWEHVERFRERNDEISAALFILDIHNGKVKAGQELKKRSSSLLSSAIDRLLDQTMDGFPEGKVDQLIAHYKKHIGVLLRVCVLGNKLADFYNVVWPRLSQDVLSKAVLLDQLDEYVLDGAISEPPPSIVCEYLKNLATEGHFSQFQAAVVRFPIYTIDIHYVMSTCRQNGLYDGVIYVMNNALCDFLSPLEEMLEVVGEFAGRDVLSDAEVDAGNRLLLYLHCCLAGTAYPFGQLPQDQSERVPLEVYRCVNSMKGKDGSESRKNYPYLRLLLLFDPQQFVHVISTCADAPIFQSDNRLQRMADTIGYISVETRSEATLINYIQLCLQLIDRHANFIAQNDLIQDAAIELLRLPRWQNATTETSILQCLKSFTIDHTLLLKVAQNPLRAAICSFILMEQRRFVELVKCFLNDASSSKNVFHAISHILKSAILSPAEADVFNKYVISVLPTMMSLDGRTCAKLIVEHYAEQLKVMDSADDAQRRKFFPVLKNILDFRREGKERTISGDEDLDERLMGCVVEGICKGWLHEPIDGELLDCLQYWLPVGSRTDFCLNQVAAAGLVKCKVVLLEARNFPQRAFEALFEQLEATCGVDETLFVHWLDELLYYCERHSRESDVKEWLMTTFNYVLSSSTRRQHQCSIEEMNERLFELCVRILDTGTENAALLMRSLFESEVFLKSTLGENQRLLDEILTACRFEKTLLREVVKVIKSETSTHVNSTAKHVGKRSRAVFSTECYVCQQLVTKSAYVFRCGHIVHMDCEKGDKVCSCENRRHNVPTSLEQVKSRSDVSRRNIFSNWETPLKLYPRAD